MTRVCSALLLVLALVAPPAMTDPGPAVSGPNGKLAIVGGAGEPGNSVVLQGSATVPLGFHLGAQLDGLVGEFDGDLARGAALHLFWRNPDVGMLGLTGSRVELDSIRVERIGVAGELYRGDWTFGAEVGQQRGDVSDETYGSLSALRYIGDGMRLDFSVEGVGDRVSGTIGAEWALSQATSLRLAALGGDGETTITLGVEMTFGGSGNGLKGRDRQDDPINGLFGIMTSQAPEIYTVRERAEARAREEYCRGSPCACVSGYGPRCAINQRLIQLYGL